MAKKIGIPRALLYYQQYPMWKTFFEELGLETIVSPPTTKAILADGSSRMVAETCLPVKVFCGHVAALADKVDYIFVPSVRSIETDVYNCPKFLGLPDLVRTAVPTGPPILDLEIDVNKGEKTVRREIHQLGHNFTRNPFKINRAYDLALKSDQAYRNLLQSGMPLPQAIRTFHGGDTDDEKPEDNWDTSEHYLTIAVVGHPYNIYDAYINHNLLKRLMRMGVRVVTPEMATPGKLDAGTSRLVGRPYWTYEDEVVGAAGHYLESGSDGVLGLVCFGCGPDSMMLEVVQRAAKAPVLSSTNGHRPNPFTTIVMDEHTGEAGLVTRLEAFVDMLERRKRRSQSQ